MQIWHTSIDIDCPQAQQQSPEYFVALTTKSWLKKTRHFYTTTKPFRHCLSLLKK